MQGATYVVGRSRLTGVEGDAGRVLSCPELVSHYFARNRVCCWVRQRYLPERNSEIC